MAIIERAVVGKTYEPTTYEITKSRILAFARSYGDERPDYEEVAPLAFAAVYSFEAGLGPLFDPQLTADPARLMRRLVRGSLDLQVLRPVVPGDVLRTEAKVEAVTEKSSGELLEIDTRSVDAKGELVAIVKNFHFIRGEKTDKKASPAADKAEPAPVPIDWETTFTVPATLPLAYAEASMDRNPIHTDDNFAKMAGFRGIIVQGSATLAIAQRAIVDSVCGGDPRKLARVRARFVKAVYPGDTLTTRGGRLGAFEMVNEEGNRVLEEGAFEALGMNL